MAKTKDRAAKLVNPKRMHPHRSRWVADEARMRASFIATRDILAPFIVPHRFEGNQAPDKLKRAALGYGIRLNASYIGEILGHLRGASITHEWGALAEGEPDPDGTPKGGIARGLHSDADGKGKTLRNFMEGEGGVAEWYLTSVGGFLIVDTPPRPAEVKTRDDERRLGLKPYLRFMPWSAVLDLDTTGMTWIKFSETVDLRTPEGEGKGLAEHYILYKLVDGATVVGRYNKDGECVDAKGNPAQPVNLGPIVDGKGRPSLPIHPVKRGTHPIAPYLGTGALYGLDDIVVDLFNVTNEMREAYRDAAFTLLKHKGPGGDDVETQLKNGTRLAKLGEDHNADLERLAGDSTEVSAGMELIRLGVVNWALSAKRQAAEAMSASGGADSSSGVALESEFRLDLKPLLVSVAAELDTIETVALHFAAQLSDNMAAADKLRVTRSTEYKLEDEAARISRIVGEYAKSLPLTPTMKVQLAKRWMEEAKLIDLSETIEKPKAEPLPEVESEDDATGTKLPVERTAEPEMETVTVGEQIERELWEIADAEQAGAVASLTAGPLGPGGAV